MTAPSTWPGLGFDPAPGDVAAMDGLATRLIDASRTLLGARDTLDSVRTAPGGWEGDAARAFTTKVGELPERLDNAHASLDKVTSELHRWQAGLERLQARARDLEARALAARGQLADAEVGASAARSAPDLGLAGRNFDTDADLADAQNRLNAALATVSDADRRLKAARGSLEQLIQDGQRLLAHHRAGADTVAAGIRAATEGLAPPEPGWLDEAGDCMLDHAGDIGDVAGVVSAVTGTLALLPPLTPIAGPIAVVSGAVALGAHGVDISEKGSWGDPNSWFTLGGDALGMVPALGALSMATEAGVEAARLGGGLLTTAGGATELTSTPMSRAAEELGRVFYAEGMQPDAAPVFQRLGEATEARWGGNAQVIGKVEQGAVNVGLQAPTVNGWTHPSQENDEMKTGAGVAGGVANTLQTMGESTLAEGLGRFAGALR